MSPTRRALLRGLGLGGAALLVGAGPAAPPPVPPGGAHGLVRARPAPGPPVLLVHGLASRSTFFGFPRGTSLAEAVAAAGFDLWTLDLGGRQGTGRRQSGPPRRRELDHHGQIELTAALDAVRAARGDGRGVAVVGHSMGGMITAVHAAAAGTGRLSAVVAMGSPLRFTGPDPLMQLSRATMGAGRGLPRVPTAPAVRAAGLREDALAIEAMIAPPGAIAPETRQGMIHEAIAPITGGELAQLQDALRAGAFRSRDGRVDYATVPATMDCPVMAVAGRADRVAPPDRVAPWRAGPPGAPRRWLLAGRAGGMGHDYGHIDMVAGIDAHREVFPPVLAFLRAHAV